jgi:N-acetylmuramoyl-L-alanine amidase
MKICIDAGHGMGNRTAGVFDSGAVGGRHKEAHLTLAYALALEAALAKLGVEVWLTRRDNDKPCPVGRRASNAAAAGCTAFVSLHFNAHNGRASGVEVLYRETLKDKPLAEIMQAALVRVTGLPNRGVKSRRDLAVLKFAPGPAVLLEMGFIDNPRDRALILQDAVRMNTAEILAKTLRDALVAKKPAFLPSVSSRRFERIHTTEFGGGAEAGMPSAYGGTVDPRVPQAALPARVTAGFRWVVVRNEANGRMVRCRVNDVGPWNTRDAYWFTEDGRPLAEKQFRNKTLAQNGRIPVSPAGLDLTPAAMDALDVPGRKNNRSALLTWWFVE